MEFMIWTYLTTVVLTCVIKVAQTQCDDNGTQILTASSTPQYFSSPNYPSDYPTNAVCSWRIQAHSEYDKIIINIEDMDTESVSTDYLDLHDGYNTSSIQIIRMAGTNKNDLHAFVSSGDVLYFSFVSDYSLEYSGFQILYFSNDTAHQAPCDTNLAVSTGDQILMSPNMPRVYNEFDTCSWTFSSSTGILFEMKFLDMGTCGSTDHLTFYDGSTTADTQLESLCHTASTYAFNDIETTVFSAHVAWTVTNQSSNYYGFMLLYRENIITTTTTTIATTTQPSDDCSASGDTISAAVSPAFSYIYSPGYFNGQYPSNTDCRWYVNAPAGYAVEATFDSDTYAMEYSYYCSYDYVSFYDGGSTDDPLINKVCGTSRPSSTYRSSGTSLLIIFSSDYSLQYAGFRINVQSVDNSYPACKAGFTTFTATSTVQTFSTANSPYDGNADEYFLVENQGGGELILQLTAMNVERASGCIYDRIIIYNGACTKDDVLEIHCGHFLKRWELTGLEYLVHFHSDSSVEKAGFTMEYYLGTVSTGPPTTTTTTVGPPVSAEVALLIEVLANYSAENFPVRNLSNAVKTSIDVFLAGINGLDEVQQKLTTTIQFEVKWVDENMQWEPTKKQGITKLLIPQDDLWKPDLALLNSFTKISAMGHKFMFVLVEHDGKCTWKPYQILESTCKADMTDYPYDTQACDIKLSTWASSTDQVETSIGSSGMQKHQLFVENAEWRLLEISQRDETINGQLAAVFTLTLKRNPSFIVFYISIPVIVLSLLNALTFALPVQAGEKSGYAITIFLSFLIYLIVTFQKMPENSDSISLFALYVLALTGLSNLTVMISVLEIRMASLKIKNKPMLQCTISFTKWILKLQQRLLCIKKNKTTEHNTEVNCIEQSNAENYDHEADEDGEAEDDNVWPEFVSALDFVCFWVFLVVTVGLAVGYMVYLSNK